MDAEPLAAWTPRRLVALTAVTSFATAMVFRGRVHPDEVFQVLEPAHRAVFGYGVVAWEWKVGLRNRVVVDLVAELLRFLTALHIERPQVWVSVIWALCACWQASGALALYRIVEARDGSGPARLATAVLATWGGFLIFGARPLGDALAIPALLWSFWYVQRSEGFVDGFLGGAALGAAVVARYPSLVFTAPLGIAVLGSRNGRAVLGFVLSFVLVFATLGILDGASWGDAFHSFRLYVEFNQPSGRVVTSFGKEPWYWYIPIFGALAPYFLAWQFVRGLRTHALATGAFVLYLALLEVHPHKEERFLLPLVPLGLIVAAPAMWEDLGKILAKGVRWRRGLIGGYAVWSALSATLLRPFDLGRDDIQAEAVMAADPDLRGILLVGEWWSCGGYFYLHRNVPMPIGAANDPRMPRERAADSPMTHILAVGEDPHAHEWKLLGWHEVWHQGEVGVWKRSPPPIGDTHPPQ